MIAPETITRRLGWIEFARQVAPTHYYGTNGESACRDIRSEKSCQKRNLNCDGIEVAAKHCSSLVIAVMFLWTIMVLGAFTGSLYGQSIPNHEALVSRVQERVVKLFGAGGVKGLENYQSGILIGNEGYIVTSWSTVLDVDKVRVVSYDGKRMDAVVVGVDPPNEIALLKVDDAGLIGFELDAKRVPRIGQRVFGISNLFGIATGNESCSVQKGVVMAVTPLTQRRGKTKSLYQGKVYVLDVMTNNPGACGGALVDLQGNLVGLLGKEIRDEQAGIWLNYALPIEVIQSSIDRITKGVTLDPETIKSVDKPHRLSELGLTLLPNVLPKTPPFIDQVRRGSIADKSGIQSNDLILLLNDQRVDSRSTLEKLLSGINKADSFSILVQRGQELLRIQIRP